jgi:thiol-disulfide isomerase/thioredoxin
MRGVLASLLVCGLVGAAAADEAKWEWQPTGMSARSGYYRPMRLTLSEDRPGFVTKLPDDLRSARFGVLKLGATDAPGSFTFLLDEPEDGEAKLWIDANGNGDLTDDPEVAWPVRKVKSRNRENRQWNGKATLSLSYGGDPVPLGLSFYRFDPEDPARPTLKNVILYYRDYGYTGEVKLGETTYKAMWLDDVTAGDFRGNTAEDVKDSGLALLIDLNENGKFESKGERFDGRKPFNIGGTTYELAGFSPRGDATNVIKSDKTVEPTVIPAVLERGKKPPTFEVKTLTGETLKFPDDFKDRLVMLDFWATWCGPCLGELPNLKRVYAEFHAQGFDVLGVSIDTEESRDKLTEFLKEKDIAWQQVHEPGAWDGRLPKQFGVSAIPNCVLVDGKSGLIVATTASLRGTALRNTIERRLELLGEPPTDEPESDHTTQREDPLIAKARSLADDGQLADGEAFSEMRRAPSGESLKLQPESTQPMRGREIARRAAAAYVRCGWVYHCSRCDRWHLQLAGGYAITNDVVVTAHHVMQNPGTRDMAHAYPVAVIGEDRIVGIAGVVAASKDLDAIALRVKADDLPPVPLARDPQVGDAVFCFSDPQGIRGYFSSGMVNRHFNLKPDSTDAEFQRMHVSADWAKGSSGAALYDDCGNAIGHVARIQSLFNSPRGGEEGRGAPVMTLHEAIPAASILRMLSAP